MASPSFMRLPWRRAQTNSAPQAWSLEAGHWVWLLGSLCALHRRPFHADLLLKQFPPPYTTDSLIRAAKALGFRIRSQTLTASDLVLAPLPCAVLVARPEPAEASTADIPIPPLPPTHVVLLTQATQGHLHGFNAETNTPQAWTLEEFAQLSLGVAFFVAPQRKPWLDPDVVGQENRFGFRWFVPTLLKHKHVWRDVLLASLVIQLLALGTPLFTQTIIDKVLVHRTESTLLVIAIGLAIFMVFSAALGWVRQYLLAHTGNRIDAVLAYSVFEHLFKLPPRYFEHRPTGVIAARLQGVETIREFIASAAVTLVLDLPFLLIFVAIMFWYSVPLTFIALAVLAVVAAISAAVAPLFQAQLNQQFLLGARNQAFITEYVAGVETVKSLQMEPLLQTRYADQLADYLHATFKTRVLANTYNTATTTLDQLMSLLILVAGAYTVMTSTEFTIGMLVAFQMFSGRLSQPVMRLVGLWQQFQQASLSVKRLGDLMNAPAEPYTATPRRMTEGKGLIEIEGLAFRHSEKHRYLYRDFNLQVQPGSTVAIMGASGSGKSTLAKLLQGFHQPTDGRIKIDGLDIQNLAANELRQHFGVVPQETVLFSGTIHDNLLAANPNAPFERIVQATKLAEIHDTIEQLPNGYQTEIGERGSGLSGGQRQRLAIARALLKRPKILIFDEATSALDAHTAEHFAATVNQLRGSVTMLFITHALPKGLKVDQVVRIDAPHIPAPSDERAATALQATP